MDFESQKLLFSITWFKAEVDLTKFIFLWKSAIFHSIKLSFDAEVAEKSLSIKGYQRSVAFSLISPHCYTTTISSPTFSLTFYRLLSRLARFFQIRIAIIDYRSDFILYIFTNFLLPSYWPLGSIFPDTHCYNWLPYQLHPLYTYFNC